MSHWPDPIEMATPAFIVLVLIEMLAIRFGARGDYDWRDTFTSLTMGLGSTMAAVVFGATIVATYTAASHWHLFAIPVTWWAGVLCFVLDDLLYYAFHRSAHRVRWFWASHVIHHSSQHYNLTTALRQTWTGFLSLSFAFRLPLLLIGFDVRLVLFVAAINLIYQFWVHTESVRRLPFGLEYVLNSPSHHRVHHGSNPRYLDRNYAGVFIVWDRMFGTFEAEHDDEPVRYGLVHNIATFNPLRTATHEWIAIARDLRAAKTWRGRWMTVAGPPGWTETGEGSTADTIRAAWEARSAPAE
ncbi:sterol desaturase family protein [Polymorphobacter sp. PAMC 29334]|uniref:sterol desaturase family protein n=1 Tax=Polymorphobacter sp. PAMC 29334 TaxID=2862331 RepID=UPI001C684AAD|nr:sterol desaturase family protein [Polymorphobacter sp. PAMC 29334]QYE36228.1 sterol desaturase family protein [Polymorphobacter sp. PAMC 29334]